MEQAVPPAHKVLSHAFRMRDTRSAIAGAGAYTRWISTLRFLLPFAVLGVFAALIVWPMLGQKQLKIVQEKTVPNLVVDHLRMTGVDKNEQPYTLTAEHALQVPEEKGLMDLDHPQGELNMKGGAWMSGKADKGRYDEGNKKLWLGGDVQFFHDRGYQFNTSEAQFDLSKNNAWGEHPVTIQGSFGEIEGEGFHLTEGGKVMVVTGRSKATLNLHQLSSSSRPASSAPPLSSGVSK